MRPWTRHLGLLCALTCAQKASAQEGPDGLDELSVQLRAGVVDFTGGLGALSSPGPLLGVAVGGTYRRRFGVEVSYEGSRHAAAPDQAQGASPLWRHNIHALARASYPLGRFLPFAGVGVGATYANVEEAGDEVFRRDLLQEIPLAAGVEYNAGPWTAGLRGSYRVLINDELVRESPTTGEDAGGGLLGFSLTVGARF